MNKRPAVGDELRELYSDKNLSKTVRDILHATNREFDIGSDEYDENLKSRYTLLCRRIRDAHTAPKSQDNESTETTTKPRLKDNTLKPVQLCVTSTGNHDWLPTTGKGLPCFSCPLCKQRIYWTEVIKKWVKVTPKDSALTDTKDT